MMIGTGSTANCQRILQKISETKQGRQLPCHHLCINICMSEKKVSIQNRLLSYTKGVRGHWHFKASVFNDYQILIVGHNKLNNEFFTRVFTSYEEAVGYLEFLTFSQFSNPDLPKWDLKAEN